MDKMAAIGQDRQGKLRNNNCYFIHICFQTVSLYINNEAVIHVLMHYVGYLYEFCVTSNRIFLRISS